ncbi:MAG TPA: acyltransferase family protein [Methanobacterium sp.]|nr:acyltransferase family protein [Methanobacterium sp.]
MKQKFADGSAKKNMNILSELEVNRSDVEVKTEFETASTSRIYFIDNLKILLAVLVVLHHAAQPYGPGGGWWIPSESTGILDFVVLGIFMAFNASFFMGLFFMLSAYFVPSSLARKGADKFVKDRLVKLGVPILIFMFIVFPVMDYLLNYQIILFGHLWFLAMLLIFSTVYVAYWLVKRPSTHIKRPFPSNAAILTFIVVMALISFVVRIWWPENQWALLGLFEPFHVIQYIMLFAAGIIAYRQGWFEVIPKATGKLWSRVAIVTLISLLFVGGVTNSMEFSGGLTVASLLGSFWEAFMCVSICIALLSLFKNRFNSQGLITKTFADDTFTVYLIQLPLVVFLQYMIIGLALDPLIKFVIVGVIGVPLAFALSHYVIRRLPYAKYVLG